MGGDIAAVPKKSNFQGDHRGCSWSGAFGFRALGGRLAGMPEIVNYASEPNSVEIREVPVREIGDQDVLLAVQAVGVCGTDIHLAYGHHVGRINYPVILGHEFGGVIAQVGKHVRGFKEGDRVVSETAAIIDENSP